MSNIDCLRLKDKLEDGYFHCERCDGGTLPEIDKLASRDDVLQNMEVKMGGSGSTAAAPEFSEDKFNAETNEKEEAEEEEER
ncbi:hypothetical protein ACFX15_036189 [Malus domestica]